MINITSNINSFQQNYLRKTNGFRMALQKLAYELAIMMSEDMKKMIFGDLKWQESGNLSTIGDVSFRPEILSTNMVRVHIGENLPLLKMKDGTLVNPAFFIEFGFVIEGQNKPKQNHEEFNWEYNINNHQDYWYFSYNGEHFKSKGREGLNFMYITMQNYITKWRIYFYELVARYTNV